MRVLYLFSRKIFENFDILHAFLGLTITKLASLKTVRFFLAHPVHVLQSVAVRQSIRLFPLWLLNCLIFDIDILHVYGS